MNIKKFNMSCATLKYIDADFSRNIMSNKEAYLLECANNRINEVNNEYNQRVDNILNYIILRYDYRNMPLDIIAKILRSVSKVTNTMLKGILSIIRK